MPIGTPTNLGHNSGSVGTTVVITTSATANVGDLITVVIGSAVAGSVTSVTDSAGNSYGLDKSDTAGTNQDGWIYSSIATTQLASGGTITVNKASGQATAASAAATSGIATTTPLDQVGSANGNSSTPSASATTVNANDLVIGLCVYQTSTLTQPGGAWNPLTGDTTLSGSVKIGWAYQIVSSIGTYTYNPTLSFIEPWADIVTSYKAAVTADTLFAQSAM